MILGYERHLLALFHCEIGFLKGLMMKNKQNGVVLIISMIMLLMMTLLGVTAMKTALMEEKMAGNSRDTSLAFQAAETGLRDAEVWIANEVNEPQKTVSGTNRVWVLEAMDPVTTNATSWWQEPAINQTWWETNSQATTAIGKVKTPPHNIIEYKQFIPDTLLKGTGTAEKGMTYYQVTSRGTGGSDQARVLLQSTTARRF